MARKQKTIHYLYKTTCLITGRWYIGMHSTTNLEDGYMGSGLRLRRSIRKYGEENHKKEILEFFDSRELLIEAEKKAITLEMVNDDMCMNLKPGGSGGFCNEEHMKKAQGSGRNSMEIRKEKDENYKKIFQENGKKQLSAYMSLGTHNFKTFLDKKHTETSKQKISEANKVKQKGELNSQYGTCWITKDDLNKKIKKKELNLYMKDGWIKGRKY